MKVMTLAATAALCASALFAVDVDQLKGLPRGVQNIKYENGVISTLVVVGKAAVPMALRRNPGRASQYGGEKARSEAQFEFVRFLSTKCKWGKTADGETAVKEEAASATDAQGNETSAASSSFTETEMTKEQKAQSAQACISGIQGLWEGMNDSGEYVWVGAWNAKAAASIKNMATIMNEAHNEVANPGPKPPTGGQPGNGAAGNGNAAPQPGQNGAPDILNGMEKPRGTVSNDASEFL